MLKQRGKMSWVCKRPLVRCQRGNRLLLRIILDSFAVTL